MGRGLVELALVIAAFLAFGVGWHSALAGSGPYPDAVDDASGVWLVDGYNVLCTGVLGGRDRTGWWRAERRTELVALLEKLDDASAEVWVVFDGPDPAPEEQPPGRVRPVFAACADTWLLDQVGARAGSAVHVVTADRQLAERVRSRGAQVVTPRELVRRCMG